MGFIYCEGKNLKKDGEPMFLRGFGLGGWFLPEGYMWKFYTKCDRPRRMESLLRKLCGEAYEKDFWKAYLASYVTRRDIELIADHGFNCVRLPLNARHLWNREKAAFNEDIIRKVDELIGWCAKNKVYVMLDMHAAPGGQTGQNIDDSENDSPNLFCSSRDRDELVKIWKELAGRYCEEEWVAGYDLLNEPLPKWFSEYNELIMPLYRRLIREIREIDRNHMIILEGVHWATDFSVFDSLSATDDPQRNLMIQFHKYWNSPDEESVKYFLEYSQKLNIPLIMGEGGENNLEWYTLLFPMLERLGVSWIFWTYKKMGCKNSPVSFDIPDGWERLIRYLDGEEELSCSEAQRIFNRFLEALSRPTINKEVFCAIKRYTPVTIPCEGYDFAHIVSPKEKGAEFRESGPATIVFADPGRKTDNREVDYKRYGGEPQPEEENIVVRTEKGDCLVYEFFCDKEYVDITLTANGKGTLKIKLYENEETVSVQGQTKESFTLECSSLIKNSVYVSCEEGKCFLDTITLSGSIRDMEE